jgi:succinate-acetate transporter protein
MAEIDDSFPLTGFLQVYIEFSALYLVAWGKFQGTTGREPCGYLGLLTAIAAWYTSAITVIASTRKR